MATDIVAAIADVLDRKLEVNGGELEPVTTIFNAHGLAWLVRDALLDAGWTLIPPATDDLPEGWEWRLNQNSYLVDHDGSSVAALLVAKVNNTPFAPWVADRVTRLLAALGEG